MHDIIYLLLTKMNSGGQEVCNHSHLIGMEANTNWLNVMPRAVMAAKSHIQTGTWSYG